MPKRIAAFASGLVDIRRECSTFSTMPIYEYVCSTCGQIVEALQRMSDPPLDVCPSGDGGPLTRILSSHNVGGVATGWEGTDCERSEAPACGGCDLAGTGCS